MPAKIDYKKRYKKKLNELKVIKSQYDDDIRNTFKIARQAETERNANDIRERYNKILRENWLLVNIVWQYAKKYNFTDEDKEHIQKMLGSCTQTAPTTFMSGW